MTPSPAWQYNEPREQDFANVIVTVTEAEILREYYPFWCGQMHRVGKILMATEERCIEDWATIHWAWRVG